MTTHSPAPNTDAPRAGGGGKRLWLVLLALALVAAAVVATMKLTGDDAPTSESASPLALTAPTTSAGKCAVPSPEFVAQSDVAFDGTVTAINGDEVSLKVGHWYRGGDATRVTVTGPSEQLRQVLSGVEFEQGQRYLITAVDGVVTMCGLSAAYSPEMAAMYEAAFAQ